MSLKIFDNVIYYDKVNNLIFIYETNPIFSFEHLLQSMTNYFKFQLKILALDKRSCYNCYSSINSHEYSQLGDSSYEAQEDCSQDKKTTTSTCSY